jgi:hypothetical protein
MELQVINLDIQLVYSTAAMIGSINDDDKTTDAGKI